MNNKKVLIVIDSFKIGGAQDIVGNVILENYKRIDFSVCSLNGFDKKYQDALSRINVEAVDCKKSLLRFYKYLRLRADGYDVINFNLQVCSIAGSVILKLISYKNKVVISIHGLKSQLRAGVFNAMALSGRLVMANFVVEDMVARRDLKKMAVEEKNIFYIPIGVKAEAVLGGKTGGHSSDLKYISGIKEGDFVLFNVARMIRGKGQIYLLRMMSFLKDIGVAGVKLVIVGYGPERAALEDYVKNNELDNWVFILEKQDNLAPYYELADAFLMPAVDEAMGVVIFNAFAYGVPVLAFNAGSIDEAIVSGYNGELVKIGDYEALGRAVIKIMGDNNLRHKYIENSRSLLNEKFNLQKMIDGYYNLYTL